MWSIKFCLLASYLFMHNETLFVFVSCRWNWRHSPPLSPLAISLSLLLTSVVSLGAWPNRSCKIAVASSILTSPSVHSYLYTYIHMYVLVCLYIPPCLWVLNRFQFSQCLHAYSTTFAFFSISFFCCFTNFKYFSLYVHQLVCARVQFLLLACLLVRSW